MAQLYQPGSRIKKSGRRPGSIPGSSRTAGPGRSRHMTKGPTIAEAGPNLVRLRIVGPSRRALPAVEFSRPQGPWSGLAVEQAGDRAVLEDLPDRAGDQRGNRQDRQFLEV